MTVELKIYPIDKMTFRVFIWGGRAVQFDIGVKGLLRGSETSRPYLLEALWRDMLCA